MSDPLVQELENALGLVREAIDAKAPLNRYHARSVLLPLGELLRRDGPGTKALEQTRTTIERDRASWDAAVKDEIELAVFEHVRSADPQYVGRPDYDMVYTREARERLQARFDALKALGGTFERSWIQRVERADAILAPHQRAR